MSIRTKPCITIIAILFISGVSILFVSGLNNDRSEIIPSKVEENIRKIVFDGNLPSLQVAVVHQNQQVWSRTYGMNTTVEYVYMNGSVQKVFDATAILQIYERKLIDLDADINAYIPFTITHPGYPKIPITIRMLLAHRSGLGDFKNQFDWDTECIFYPMKVPEQYHQQATDKPELVKMPLEKFLRSSLAPNGTNYNPSVWIDKPGERYHYSVSAYPLLRYLIEQVTGKSYPDYMRENILEPLGMRNTGFNSKDFIGRHAIPYTRIDGQHIELPVWNGNGYLMRTTAEDMTKFMMAHMNNGLYGHYQLLRPETIEMMRERTSRRGGILSPSGYGLGLDLYGHGWIGHGGSTVGYQSLWQLNPSRQVGFIIFTNVNGILGGGDNFQAVWKHVAAIRDVMLSELHPMATVEFFPWGFFVLCASTSIIMIIRKLKCRSAA